MMSMASAMEIARPDPTLKTSKAALDPRSAIRASATSSTNTKSRRGQTLPNRTIGGSIDNGLRAEHVRPERFVGMRGAERNVMNRGQVEDGVNAMAAHDLFERRAVRDIAANQRKPRVVAQMRNVDVAGDRQV